MAICVQSKRSHKSVQCEKKKQVGMGTMDGSEEVGSGPGMEPGWDSPDAGPAVSIFRTPRPVGSGEPAGSTRKSRYPISPSGRERFPPLKLSSTTIELEVPAGSLGFPPPFSCACSFDETFHQAPFGISAVWKIQEPLGTVSSARTEPMFFAVAALKYMGIVATRPGGRSNFPRRKAGSPRPAPPRSASPLGTSTRPAGACGSPHCAPTPKPTIRRATGKRIGPRRQPFRIAFFCTSTIF
jgi:hypothetical protein